MDISVLGEAGEIQSLLDSVKTILQNTGRIHFVAHGVSWSADHYNINVIGTPQEIFDYLLQRHDDELSFIGWNWKGDSEKHDLLSGLLRAHREKCEASE